MGYLTIDSLTKYYPSELGKQYVFRDLSFEVPLTGSIALLGPNGAGKSTLFRMLAGSEFPNSGSIKTDLSISWPVALSTGIHPKMTGRENARFIGRVNGVENLDEYVDQVQRTTRLKHRFDLPVRNYSSGMRSRLAFACCISIDFDIYLIDEVTSVGDPKFRRRARRKLIDKAKHAMVLMVSHDMEEIRQFCNCAIVISKGRLVYYSDLEEAISVYDAL